MKKWECYRCSYTTEAENPPEECPNCHYSVTFWLGLAEKKEPTLKDFVRRNILKLDDNESALVAARLMKENDTENILVTVDGEPVGMVTERDILYKVAAEDLPASRVLLKDIMTSPLVFASADIPVNEGLRLMAKRHIRRVIVTEGGKAIGIVSHRSILGGSFRLSKDQTEDEEGASPALD